MVSEEYQIVSQWVDVKLSENEVIFDCRTDRGNQVLFKVSFLAPGIARFFMNTMPSVDRSSKPNLLMSEETEPVKPEFHEKGGKAIIGTEELRIEVQKEPWKIEIYDSEGSSIIEENIDDKTIVSGYRLPPLGFSSDEGGEITIQETLKLGAEEHIYGFGEKFTDFDKRGQDIHGWTGMWEFGSCEEEGEYKNIPFFTSSKGYGIFINSTSRMTHKVGSETTISYSLELEDNLLDWIFIHGPSLKRILSKYTSITGRPSVPPKWSFGLWMSRGGHPEVMGYGTRRKTEEICKKLREKEIPCDVIHLDPDWMRSYHQCDLVWDEEAFPEPDKMADNLHEMGFKLSLWENPYVSRGTEAFREGVENNYFVRDEDGLTRVIENLAFTYGEEGTKPERGAVVDFSNPEAVEWWKDKHRKLFDMGVDVFKTDFGEQAPENGLYDNGLTGKYMHNYYPVLYNKAVFEVSEEKKGEGLVWGRSAYAGSQRYPVNWGGDPMVSFEAMASTLRGGLSYGMSGCPFWSHDIGGHFGVPDPELYVRWAQFGLLSSHSRCHGFEYREPWKFGKRAEKIFKKFDRLRYRLIPYLYSYANVASSTGLPVMRPMVLEFQEDPNTYTMDTQYMLGEELLVAPVFNREGKKRVYLPRGAWYDYWTGEKYEGPKNLKFNLDLDEIPLFVKGNSIVPIGPVMQYVGQKEFDPLTLRVFVENEANFEVFEKKGESFEIEACRTEGKIVLKLEKADRNFTAEIYDVSEPKRIILDGSELSDSRWSYDAEDRVVEIKSFRGKELILFLKNSKGGEKIEYKKIE